jgi:L-threonylcarbamoyladenylate synthase
MSLWHLRQAVFVLRRGGIIAYPTEAVYGLGCDPLRGDSIQRLLQLKQRSVRLGLIVIGADFQQLAPFVLDLNEETWAQVVAPWPSPVTWLLPARAEVPGWLTGGRETIAVRVTAHPIAAALCRYVGMPLVSTSANRHRHPPARSHLQVRRAFGNRLDYIVPGRVGKLRRPTPIRNALTGEQIRG